MRKRFAWNQSRVLGANCSAYGLPLSGTDLRLSNRDAPVTRRSDLSCRNLQATEGHEGAGHPFAHGHDGEHVGQFQFFGRLRTNADLLGAATCDEPCVPVSEAVAYPVGAKHRPRIIERRAVEVTLLVAPRIS